ncbi:MAG: signal peptidase I [Cyanobacteria bacterium]|jgi:signal peptidase I|nr:signal peptidase I [Cyanobacteriota bacterium]
MTHPGGAEALQQRQGRVQVAGSQIGTHWLGSGQRQTDTLQDGATILLCPLSAGPVDPQPPAPRAALLRQLRGLLVWVALALLLRWAVIEPRWIPSGSMLPTLQLQDRVLVEKLRVRLHRPLAAGAVVVFHPPAVLQAAGYDPGSALIKRLVGLPGDRISIHDGVLWRNGTAVQPDWAAEPMQYELAELTVPEGELLVLGDNRNASLDSHLWGTLDEQELIGTAVLRYWPPARFGPIRVSTPGGAG